MLILSQQARFIRMSLQTIADDLAYPLCRRQGHREELSQVCTDRKCRAALICPLCEQADHQGHATLPLRQFLKEADLLPDQDAFRLALTLQSDLQALEARFRGEMGRVKEEFLRAAYELETAVTSYFSLLGERYYQTLQRRREAHLVETLSSALSSQDSEKLEALVNDLKASRQITISDQLQFCKSYSAKRFEAFQGAVGRLNFQKEFAKATSAMEVPNGPLARLAYWWSALKAPSILINGSVATQKDSNSSAERFALIDGGGSGELHVRVRVSKLKGWIGVGICLRERIVKAGYKFNYTVAEHGSYLISANGYSWSHSRPEYNSAYKSFVFHEGDTIAVDYSPADRRVSFESALTGSKFYLSTVDCPPDDCYVPCVNLCNTGDEVELINDL